MSAPYFVRVVLKRSKTIDLLVRLRCSGFSDSEVAKELADWVFDDDDEVYSVYAMQTCNRHDESHAIGLMAVTITSENFDERARTKLKERTDRWFDAVSRQLQPKQDDLAETIKSQLPMTLILSGDLFGNLIKSPEANESFTPADDLHFDLRSERQSLAIALLENLKSTRPVCTILTAADFRTQAAIALSACLRLFRKCEIPSRDPADFRDEKFPPHEQLARLRVIAGDFGWQDYLVENKGKRN